MAGGGGNIIKKNQAREVVALLAIGRNPEEISAELSISKSTVYKWMRNPDISRDVNEVIREKGKYRVARALHVLEKQLDHPNPWVAQAASRIILERFGAALEQGENDNVIRIEGMPNLGVPDGTIGRESVDAEEEEDIENSDEIEIDATIK